jgi:hypothetical protein
MSVCMLSTWADKFAPSKLAHASGAQPCCLCLCRRAAPRRHRSLRLLESPALRQRGRRRGWGSSSPAVGGAAAPPCHMGSSASGKAPPEKSEPEPMRSHSKQALSLSTIYIYIYNKNKERSDSSARSSYLPKFPRVYSYSHLIRTLDSCLYMI